MLLVAVKDCKMRLMTWTTTDRIRRLERTAGSKLELIRERIFLLPGAMTPVRVGSRGLWKKEMGAADQ